MKNVNINVPLKPLRWPNSAGMEFGSTLLLRKNLIEIPE